MARRTLALTPRAEAIRARASTIAPMSPRQFVPAAVCAVLTLVALLVPLPPAVTALLVLALVLGPAVTAFFASRGLDALGYVATGMVAALAVALIGGVVNEVRNDDYQTGIIFVGTLLVGLIFTLPPVLILALLRRN